MQKTWPLWCFSAVGLYAAIYNSDQSEMRRLMGDVRIENIPDLFDIFNILIEPPR